MDAPLLTGLDKGLPPGTAGRSVPEFLAARPRLSMCTTPVAVLDDTALDANIAQMAAWCAERGVALAPHGKTSMAPALWRRQLDAGAWGITVATPQQAAVALATGVPRILVANPVVDPVALRALTERDGEAEVRVWADSTATLSAMDAGLSSTGRPLPVLVELGAAGARAGARSMHEALAVADAIVAHPRLALAGVAGWEGALATDVSEASVSRVRDFLGAMLDLHETFLSRGQYEWPEVLLTAGGSTFFDDVADVLGPAAAPSVTVLLRSGCYLTHDDGQYRAASPLSRAGTPFTAALHVWARVLSRPEPGLALLDAGRRDVGFDAGLPEPQVIADTLGAPARSLTDAHVSALNDQHAYLRLPDDADVRVGQVVRLGISHPCTTFDKWRLIPVVGPGDDPELLDLVATYF
ncbi:alanine racemase [Nakamurella deserti]|uniref:alanine racemase n=1 Tax=Nakamurella deserti TaxID=2164074 RepID=UPI000DBEA652|nr:alanine racemase [Nakamurella deserti]